MLSPLDTKSSSTVPTSSSWTGWTKLATLRDGVTQVWRISAIDRLIPEFLKGGRVSAAMDEFVVEARGDPAGDVLAIGWLTRDAFGVAAGDVLASVWLVLGDWGGFARFCDMRGVRGCASPDSSVTLLTVIWDFRTIPLIADQTTTYRQLVLLCSWFNLWNLSLNSLGAALDVRISHEPSRVWLQAHSDVKYNPFEDLLLDGWDRGMKT